MKEKLNVAILGATGAVGEAMLKGLEERNFPIQELHLLASKRSAGKKVMFKRHEIEIEEADLFDFHGMDIVFGAVENDLAEQYARDIVKAGAIFIDNSSAFRLNPLVPLIIPEINQDQIKEHKGIIANPNCATILALMAIQAIQRLSPITSMVVSTYQAVSGAGTKGIEELEDQVEATMFNQAVQKKIFPEPIAYNVIPQIGDFDEFGYSKEEMKLQNEGRKILRNESLLVSCTCVRVPVIRCHSEAIQLVTEKSLTRQEIEDAMKNTLGIIYMEEGYPTPFECSDEDMIYVGRLRKDLTHDHGWMLWCCGDQIRKGAAINAVQIAEAWLKMNH